jgi:hypothetical protein
MRGVATLAQDGLGICHNVYRQQTQVFNIGMN